MEDLDAELVLPILLAMIFFAIGTWTMHARLRNKTSLWCFISLLVFLVTSVLEVALNVLTPLEVLAKSPALFFAASVTFLLPAISLISTSVLFWLAASKIKPAA